MLKALYSWYLQTFLPFEDPAHPLFHDHAAELQQQQELDEAWDDLCDAGALEAPHQYRYTVHRDEV